MIKQHQQELRKQRDPYIDDKKTLAELRRQRNSYIDDKDTSAEIAETATSIY